MQFCNFSYCPLLPPIVEAEFQDAVFAPSGLSASQRFALPPDARTVRPYTAGRALALFAKPCASAALRPCQLILCAASASFAPLLESPKTAPCAECYPARIASRKARHDRKVDAKELLPSGALFTIFQNITPKGSMEALP